MSRMALALLCAALAWTAPGRAAALGNPAADLAAQARKRYEQGQYPEALRLYREALLQDPKSAQLHFNTGDALFKTEDYEGAAKEYGAALQGTGARLRAQSLYNMGNAYFQQQRFDQAADAYKQALELDWKDLDAKANLELALQRLQEQQQGGGQQQGKQQQQRQQDQQRQEQQQQQSQQKQQQDQQDQQDQSASQARAEEQQQETQGQSRGMTKEEAEQILQALKDRELQGRLRRSPVPARPPDKDW